MTLSPLTYEPRIATDGKDLQVCFLSPAGLLLELRHADSGQELIPQAATRRSSNAALAVLLSEVCGFALKVIFQVASGRR